MQQDLQDFVERPLAEADENRVLSYLRKHPRIEASALKRRNQADLMRNLGRLIGTHPVASAKHSASSAIGSEWS
jgi:hypothetical protein